MRNLKKFLALVLAMVMAFSLMLTANATNTAKDFDDAANITPEFVEAADVLTGMKVFQGDEGGFRPGDSINRAEVAALIYRLATGDVNDVRSGTYAGYGGFVDVNESDWFAGYVGYCANAGYIKGHDGYFNPYDSVTGYETLAMILRAIGYDKNGEFTGPTWETNVSALATNLGILANIKTTHYGDTLYLASRRDVVAELLFQADARVNMVIYTPAFGYQPYGVTGGVVGTEKNPTLGERIFGLAEKKDGILLGNQQTGESGSVLGYAGTATKDKDGKALAAADQVAFTAYAWNGTILETTHNAVSDGNIKYELETGIDLIGHKLRVWYDNGKGTVSNNKKHVYAYFDEASLTEVVKADNTILNAYSAASGTVNLLDAANGAGFKVSTSTTAVFNNSFGLFGTNASTDAGSGITGDGRAANGAASGTKDDTFTDAAPAVSAVKMYKLISNSSDKSLDAVIALNIESSQITESNNVNRVPTIGVPVTNAGSVDGGATSPAVPAEAQLQTKFIDTDNVKTVNGTDVGVLAQDALVGNSTKTLGDYEFGIHITGTTIREPSNAEKVAVKTTNTNATLTETAYYLLNKVTAPVEGVVVAYNVNKGTVTLDNGTVLERSKYYHTVVGWSDSTPKASSAPASVIPQSWVQGGTNWEEGYANVTYKFYVDYEGKYLGAERTYGSSFLYGTYLDYDQKTSTSTFNYYLTGVNLNGEIETKQISKYWDPNNIAAGDTTATINSTDVLGIPYRDSHNTATSVNGIGEGKYIGFAITGDVVDSVTGDPYSNRNEYLNNMRRLGVYQASESNGGTDLDDKVTINSSITTLGAVEVGTTGRFFTEGTKFILVSGFGTDSVKAEVYDGISDLKGSSSSVILRLDETVNDGGTGPKISGLASSIDVDKMTYYTESPYTYAQTNSTAMKIDTIILPKEAVSRVGGSNLYYVGDPTPSLVNSWGIDAWKYDLYIDGDLQQVWLTNNPSQTAANQTDSQLKKDTFMNLQSTGKTANDGQPIYTAGSYNTGTGAFDEGLYLTNTDTADLLPGAAGKTYLTEAVYSAMTRDAQTATFSPASGSKLLRVAEAKVVNLNTGAVSTGNYADVDKCASGEIWPGINDLATLNEAGSISPVTGRQLKVAAVIDSGNPLVVTTIYVCWDQATS